MTLRIAVLSLAACLAGPALAESKLGPAAREELTLRLDGRTGERSDFRLDVSGSYGPSPGEIIFRDAAYGTLLGGALGGGLGLAMDGDHWGRDLVIGAGAGLVLGTIVGIFDAQTSGGRISIHAAADEAHPEGTLALGGPALKLGHGF